MTVTIELWQALTIVGVVAVAACSAGLMWGYTAGDRRWRG